MPGGRGGFSGLLDPPHLLRHVAPPGPLRASEAMPQAIQHRPPKEWISDLDATKSLHLETLNSSLDAALGQRDKVEASP